jgi:hypothetical protein
MRYVYLQEETVAAGLHEMARTRIDMICASVYEL